MNQENAATPATSASPATSSDQGIDAEMLEMVRAYEGTAQPETKAEAEPVTDQAAGQAADALEGVDSSLIEAARRMGGMSDDEIRETLSVNRDAGMRMLRRFDDAAKRISAKFGEAGSKAMEPTRNNPAVPTPEEKPLDIVKTLVEEAGLDDDQAKALGKVLSSVAKPMQEKISAFEAERETAREAGEMHSFILYAERQMPTLASGADLYGNGSFDSATEDQQKNRREFVQTARMLLEGAAARGVNLPVNDAFAKAHRMVLADSIPKTTKQEAMTTKVREHERRRSVPPSQTRSVSAKSELVHVGSTAIPADVLASIEADVNAYLGR